MYAHARLIVPLVLLVSAGYAQPTTALSLEESLRDRLHGPLKALDLGMIMLGEDFFGAAPSGVRWADTSEGLTFSWKRWNEPERKTWQYELGDVGPEVRSDDQPQPPRGRFDRDRLWRVYTEGPSAYVEDLTSGEITEVLRLAVPIFDVRFSADAAAVLVYVRGAVYRVSLRRPGVVQLLAISGSSRKKDKDKDKESDPPEKPKDLADYHQREQREMSRRLWEKERREKAAKERSEKRKKKQLEIPSYGPPSGFTVQGVSVSPSGRHVAITLRKSGAQGRSTEMPDYVTDDGYARMRSTRTKVGDKATERRLEIMDMESGEIVRVNEPEEKRGAYPGSPSWSATGELLVAHARSDDDEDLWLLKVDPASGTTTILHHQHDDAWVGSSDGRPQWLGDSTEVFFVSEKTGWMQLWIADVATGETRQLTAGGYEIRRPVATPDGEKIYAIATPTSPHVSDLVEISPKDGSVTVLTADGGGRSFTLSPDGEKVAEVFSVANTPWELRVRWLDGSRDPVVLTDSPSPAFKGYGRWRKPPIVWFTASDGVQVPARVYRPDKPLPGKPAVLFVHGAGYLQNVHNWWSSYYREYGFHHLLCDEGYTVLDVDYRGSAGYGRDWRTAIYGHMGGRDLGDYVDAARWLVETEQCGKLGIYGGSYGGFMTLMALFTSPGTFTAGAALRPVTDWAHYNDGYTSNILDDPLESPEHYRKSSPIWHAEGLRDHLLICHGVLDSNVHAQGVFRLQQRLIELRKKNWEVAYYPLEGHGFTDAASWYDEYRRIKALFDRTLSK